MKKIALLLGASYLSGAIAAEPAAVKNTFNAVDTTKEMPEMTVTEASGRLFPNTTKATSAYTIDSLDVKTKVNVTTVEDMLRYAPSLQIR